MSARARGATPSRTTRRAAARAAGLLSAVVLLCLLVGVAPAAAAPAPTVTDLSVHRGPTAGGTTVIITGTDLGTATTVSIGGTGALIVAKMATTVTVMTPVHLSGTANVVVTTPAGASVNAPTDTRNDFTYYLTRYEESSRFLSYFTPWTVSNPNTSYSGSYIRTRPAGSAALTVKFHGVGFRIIATTGKVYGKFKMILDGNLSYVDLYSDRYLFRQPVSTVTGLADATHTLVLDYSGQKNGSATGYAVNLDALDIDGVLTPAYSRYQEWSARISYPYVWVQSSFNTGYSGSYIRTRSSPGYLTFKFQGDGFRVICTKGTSFGRLRITIDGVTLTSLFDLYAGRTLYQQAILTKTGMTWGTHTVKLAYAGSRHSLSTSNRVNLDAVDVYGTLLQAP